MKIKKTNLIIVGIDNKTGETQNWKFDELGCAHITLLLAADDSHYPQQQSSLTGRLLDI